jgi:hypothetical protein
MITITIPEWGFWSLLVIVAIHFFIRWKSKRDFENFADSVQRYAFEQKHNGRMKDD